MDVLPLNRYLFIYLFVYSFVIYSFFSDTIPVEFSYALDESEEGAIAVNLLPLLLASRNSAASKEKSDK